jgi:energy-coupling factor transporter ATP-binding protein EcfA2
MLFRRRGSKEAPDSPGSPDERSMDKRVTRAQTKAEKQARQAVKLLILGGGGSGKTTLRKQFSRLYAHAFKDAKVRVDLKDVILHNLVEGMKLTIAAAEQFVGGMQSPEAKEAAALIKSIPDEQIKMNETVAEAFRVLYKDPLIKETLEVYRSKYQLQECFLPYFTQVQSFPEWGGPIWIPSEDGELSNLSQ